MPAFAAEPRSTFRTEEKGQTVPWEEIQYSFSVLGLISSVSVKDGDVIKKGQVLAELDTEVEQATLAKEEFLLKSNVQLRAAVAQKELAEAKVVRRQKLYDGPTRAVSFEELEEAKLEATVSRLKEELANEETQARGLEVVKLKKQIERMKIVSRVDGVVRKVEAAEGEVSDPQRPSIHVVVVDRLKVNVKLPTALTNAMKIGQPLQVRYVDSDQWREAKILSFDPVGDASSGKQLVYLELPNPEQRRAGQEIMVKMPSDLASAKD